MNTLTQKIIKILCFNEFLVFPLSKTGTAGNGRPKPYIRMLFKSDIRLMHNCLNVSFSFQKITHETLWRIITRNDLVPSNEDVLRLILEFEMFMFYLDFAI